MDQFIVKVGAVEDADPRYKEFSGADYHGPFEQDAAFTFAREVEDHFNAVRKSGEGSFVYGTPETEVIQLIGDQTPDRAARNWWMES